MTHPILTRRAALRSLAGVPAAALVLGSGLSAGLAQPTAAQVQKAVAGKGIRGFDLWSGVPGSTFGDRINKTVGSRRIHGPHSWRHPVTGETITIYIRENRERNGTRIQYLTMNADGTALARVFDRRPGQASDRVFTGDAFVPMGQWRAGMQRGYSMTQYQGGKTQRFRLSIRMLRTGFTFEGRAGSMEYDWIAQNGAGRTVFHERYVYSPGLGFADFDNRL
jgi:hypothetical protein